jgi:hypothetical protein
VNNLLLNVDAGAVLFLIFVIGIAALFAAIPIILSVLFFKWLSRLGYKYVAIAVLAPIYIWLTYSIYTAIYPTDEFYYDEFKTVTLRQIPKSAVVVNKTASYPDFHGDYVSVSRIKLSKQDYGKLLKDIKADERLNKGKVIGSAELDEIMGRTPAVSQIGSVFNRSVPNEEGHYLSILFLNDKQTIVVYVSVT